MKIKIIFLSLIFIPFLGFSQFQEDTLKLDSSMFALTSSFQSFQLVKDEEELDKSLLDISFTPAKSVNVRAIRAGILEAQLNYYIVTDTSVVDSTGLNNGDLAPVFPDQSSQTLMVHSRRESTAQDTILSEYFLIMQNQWDIKKNPDQTDLNYLLHIGEWTESMFLLSKYVLRDKNMSVGARIIKQKKSVDLILGKLVEINDTTHLSEITTSFQELQTIYSAIKRKYKYKKPKVDKKTNTTTFNSKTIIKHTRKSFLQIEEQLEKIRFQILNYTENQ